MAQSRSTVGLAEKRLSHILVRQFRLRAISGPDDGMVYKSSGNRVTIGTHERADCIFADPAMSRFHCEIAISEGEAVLRDLGSRNGTVLDGVSVYAAPLVDGSVLGLGRTRLRFELGDDEVKVPVSKHESFGLLVGRSPAMRAVFALLERAAETDATVLIQGETGTGKDVAAESIHASSARKEGPFVVVDCGGIPATLLESELFGHERGAFTGADRARPGAFEAANGGTLFLDEVGELALHLQPKLLRVLEAKKVVRLGSTKPCSLDVRLVAATNRKLREEVNARRFRSDLYYRLAVFTVTLPPLRERPQDLPLLAAALLEKIGAGRKAVVEKLQTKAFFAELATHAWPGNVRELRNYLERCLALQSPAPIAGQDEQGDHAENPLSVILGQVEREYVQALLQRHPGNISAAARAAGISRVFLYRLMSRYGLR